MPEVLTHKDLQKLYEIHHPVSQKPDDAIIEKGFEEKTKKEYYYLYPDNVISRWYNGNYIVDCDGKRNELEIKNGITKTSDDKISECLKKQGFIFMYEKEAINE